MNAGNEFDVVLDTFNDKLADGTSSSNTFPSAMGVSEVRYAANSGNDGFSLKRNADSVTTNIQKGWDIEGDYAELVENNYAKFILSKNARDLVLFVGGTTKSSTGGETLTIKVGETKETTGGTKLTVESIAATASGGTTTGGGAGTAKYTTTTPLNVGTQVVLDNQVVPAGNLVVVGGPVVNALARGQDGKVSAAGNFTIEFDGSKLYVFGYTKEDTTRATDVVVSYIKSLA